MIQQGLNEYLEYMQKEKSLSDNTLESYNRDLTQFNRYLIDKNVESINSVNKTTIITYLMHLQKKGKSAATIARSLASIRSFFQYLLNLGLINEDPTYNLRPPKQEKKLPEILTKEEVDLLLSQPTVDNFIGVRDKAMLILLYKTGIKVTDLIGLNIDNLNMDLGYLLLNNYDEDIVISMDNCTLTCLKDYIENYRYKYINKDDEEALFLNYNGNRLTRQGFWKIIRQYSQKANINKNITPMTLRHSFIMHSLGSNTNINKLASIIGYSNITTIK